MRPAILSKAVDAIAVGICQDCGTPIEGRLRLGLKQTSNGPIVQVGIVDMNGFHALGTLDVNSFAAELAQIIPSRSVDAGEVITVTATPVDLPQLNAAPVLVEGDFVANPAEVAPATTPKAPATRKRKAAQQQ